MQKEDLLEYVVYKDLKRRNKLNKRLGYVFLLMLPINLVLTIAGANAPFDFIYINFGINWVSLWIVLPIILCFIFFNQSTKIEELLSEFKDR